MTATGSVNMINWMSGTNMSTGARIRVGYGNFDAVLRYFTCFVLMVELSIVKIIDVVRMFDCRVATSFPVYVIVFAVIACHL